MNLIIKPDAVSPAMLKRTLATANAEIRKHSQGAVHVIFVEGIRNPKIANIIGTLLRLHPSHSFAMVCDMPESSLSGYIAEVSEDNIETVFVDAPNIMN